MLGPSLSTRRRWNEGGLLVSGSVVALRTVWIAFCLAGPAAGHAFESAGAARDRELVAAGVHHLVLGGSGEVVAVDDLVAVGHRLDEDPMTLGARTRRFHELGWHAFRLFQSRELAADCGALRL